MEVDASSLSVGAILLQMHNIKLRPCAFFSKKFSDSERNDTIGDLDLLAITLELQEWGHLLEGSPHCILVYTDLVLAIHSTFESQTSSMDFLPGLMLTLPFDLVPKWPY